MKKFLITFIFGVILMAIGMTALIFEINEFEVVDTPAYMEQSEQYKSEIIPLKENETLVLDFEDEADGYFYSWNYDDSLKDSVKITFANGVSYHIDGKHIKITDIDDPYTSGVEHGWKRFKYLLEGLKERKIYNFDDTQILITTSHANRNRVEIRDEHY